MTELYQRCLQRGKAAEHLVCADLLLSGYEAFLADQGMRYDVVLDYQNKIYRVQVKSRLSCRHRKERNYYLFEVRRAGKGNKRLVKDNEFDILALVALDVNKIAYYKPIDQYPIQEVLMELNLG